MRCPFHPVLKDPDHSAKSAGGRLHLNTHTPLDPTKSEWADYAAVQAWCGNLSGNDLTRNLSGDIRPQSAQLAEPLWTDPCLKCRISVRELISTSKKKKKKKRRPGMNGRIFSQSPRKREKSHHHTKTQLHSLPLQHVRVVLRCIQQPRCFRMKFCTCYCCALPKHHNFQYKLQQSVS